MKIKLLVFALIASLSVNGQVVIASDGLNNSTTLFNLVGGAYFTGNSAVGDRVATSPFFSEGTHSRGVSNGTATLTSNSNIDTSLYSSVTMSLKLGSFSVGNNTNGSDATDIVSVEVSPDAGTTWFNTLRVLGNTNSCWSYAGGTANASTIYDGNITPQDFQPLGGSTRTLDGYSTMTITGLPSTPLLRFRINLVNNSVNERWVIDDFKVEGVLSSSPNIIVSPSVLTGFTYPVGFGPSSELSYIVSGSSLTANIAITAPTNYEVSLTSGGVFTNTLNIAHVAGTVIPTTIYVRLKSGLGIGSYNGEIITNVSAGATTRNVTCNGTVTAVSSVYAKGDFAVIGINSNIAICYPPGPNGAYSPGDDEISFITFRDIQNGDTFNMTDNGYERASLGTWGDGEGNYKFTRTGGTITAGTVITFRFINGSPFVEFTSPDPGWSMIKETGFTGSLIMNSGGDQIIFTQGGTWANPAGAHNATYVPGEFIYGFNTNDNWDSCVTLGIAPTVAAANQHSSLPLTLRCFNLMPGAATDFVEYMGPTTATGKLEWIARLNDPLNWANRVSCAGYLRTHVGQVYSITTGGSYVDGVWTGAKNTDWFDCSNWQTLEVPDQNVNVDINNTYAVRDAVIDIASPNATIYSNLAKSRNITISARKVQIENNPLNILETYGNLTINGAGSLDMNGGGATDGVLKLTGNWTNSLGTAAFDEGKGTVHFNGTGTQVISSVAAPVLTETFNNVVLNNNFNTSLSNDLIALGDLTVNATRTLTITSNDYVIAGNTLNNSGNVDIKDNGSFIQINETDSNIGTYTGTRFQVERIASVKNLDYVYFGSPLSTQATTAFSNPLFYRWNPTNANLNGTLGNWNTFAGNMTAGLGYINRANNGAVLAAAKTYMFSGSKPNNGTFTAAITRGTFDGADYDAEPVNVNNVLTTKFDDNWNLLGNPYPSAIDAEKFLVENQTKIMGSVWVWTHNTNPVSTVDPFYQDFAASYTTGDYVRYNGLGSTDPDTFDGRIKSGQGFMVNMLHTAATPNTVNFKNDFRLDGSGLKIDNSGFFRQQNNPGLIADFDSLERHRIWLDIVNPTSQKIEKTLIGYTESSTLGIDHFFDCIHKPKNELSIYTLIENNPYIIQGRSGFNVNDVVPVGVSVLNSGKHIIAINRVDGLFNGKRQKIFLRDLLLNVEHDLTISPYEFNADKGVLNNRFQIAYKKAKEENQNVNTLESLTLFVQNNNIEIKASNDILSYEVYNVLGQLVDSNYNVNQKTITVTNLEKSNQVFIVKVTLTTGEILSKKILF